MSDQDGKVIQSSHGNMRAVSRIMLGATPLAIRVHQQAILAEFGRRVIHTKDLSSLLHDAAELGAEGLGVDCAKVLELLPNKGRLLVRAGVGWSEGVVGVATVGADLESPAGYALHTGQPVLADDLATETRFRVPELMRRHGIQSAVNVIIRSDGEPFGVLEVDSRTPQSFSADDLNFLEGFANLRTRRMHVSAADLRREHGRPATADARNFRPQAGWSEWGLEYQQRGVELACRSTRQG